MSSDFRCPSGAGGRMAAPFLSAGGGRAGLPGRGGGCEWEVLAGLIVGRPAEHDGLRCQQAAPGLCLPQRFLGSSNEVSGVQ